MNFYEWMDYVDGQERISLIRYFFWGISCLLATIWVIGQLGYYINSCEKGRHKWKHKGTFGKYCKRCKVTWKDFIKRGGVR